MSSVPLNYRCRCCGGLRLAYVIKAREMMYGTREKFNYDVCESCRSIQISKEPSDIGKYYRSTVYSSWKGVPLHIKARPMLFRRLLLSCRADYELYGRSFLGKIIKKAFGPAEFPYDWNWFRSLKINRRSRILDFGCGSGDLLYYLRANGFKDLVGVDPFAQIGHSSNGLVFSSFLQDQWNGSFDLIMLHHSLEHVIDPLVQLKKLLPFVRAGGALLVRVPVANSYACREYGADWVQLDAPRHLVLPSESGMRALGQQLGLDLIKVEYDSTSFQFIGSEQYRKDIPMYDQDHSWLLGKNPSIDLRARQILEERSAELNASQDGDQAVFYFVIRDDGVGKVYL